MSSWGQDSGSSSSSSGSGWRGSSSSGHGSSGGGRSPGAIAAKQHANERTMEYFAAGVCGIIAIVSIIHWTHRLYVRFQRRQGTKQTPAWALPIVVVARKFRPLLLSRLTPFPSISHFVLVIAYVGLNAVLLVTQIELDKYANVANRAGWLAASNLCVVVFLALKHTPMSPLSRTSYERLNPLHQLAGLFTIAMTIIHGVAYAIYFMTTGKSMLLRRSSDVSGIVAGFAMFFMGAVPLLLKKRFYETFYVIHILSFVTLVITTAIHQPKTAERVSIMVIVAGSIWALDRIARFLRVAFNVFGNEATLHPLPDGGTRVILSKAPVGTKPGKHVFLWVPRVAMFQTHPFSVVSLEDGKTEFVVHSQAGFTRKLHNFAKANPGITVRASADGAYGAFPLPDSSHFDKVILIAGGSGASFTFGMAVNLLQHMEQLSARAAARNQEAKRLVVDLIWAVRGRENLTWFTPSLRYLNAHPHAPNVSVTLHVTRLPHSPHSESETEGDEPPVLPDPEKMDPLVIPEPLSPASSQAPITRGGLLDEEKTRPTTSGSNTSGSSSSHEGHPLKSGRPDLGAEIDAAIAGTPSHHRVLITACGPKEMMKVVREASARNIRASGPGVEMHFETFGW